MNVFPLPPNFRDSFLSANNILYHDKITARSEYEKHLMVLNKQSMLVPFKPLRVQQHYRQTKTKRNLTLKSRRIGVSTVIKADMELDAYTKTTRQAVLAHDAMTTTFLRDMAKTFWYHLPDNIRPKRNADSATTTAYENDSKVIIVTAGSLHIGRGGTFNHVHGTEVAFWKDARAILTGLLQGVPLDGNIDLESTANGAQGYFYEKCMEALDGSSEFNFNFYAWWWDEDNCLPINPEENFVLTEEELLLSLKHKLSHEQINWRRMKQKELLWEFVQEYPETVHSAFIHSGNSVFGDITHCIKAPLNAEPIEGHRYVAGGDWGQADDYSGISIIDATDDVEVYLDRYNKMRWDDMQWRMVNACIHWGVETFQPERNSIGRVNVEGLLDKFQSKSYSITTRPIETTNRKKGKWVANLYKGLHNDGLQLLDIDYATSELRMFAQGQTPKGEYTYSAASGHDDTVIMRLLAWDAACKMIS